MARLFDEDAANYIVISDSSQLTLPSGDWTIALWLYLTDNVGTAFQYFYSHDTFSANPSVNLYSAEASYSSNADEFRLRIDDADSDTFAPSGAVETIGSKTGAWYYFLAQRTGDTAEIYYDGSIQDSVTNSAVDGVDPANDLNLGRRFDGNTDRPYGGRMAEIAIWDRVLEPSEKTSLLSGLQPNQIPDSLHFYMPLWGRDTAEPELDANGNTGAITGTVTFADHAPMAPMLSIAGGG